MDLSGTNLNLLYALHVLLEERSVTRASRRLHLSQPATSSILKQCRDLFDDPLLTRARPLMQMTGKARELQPALRSALEQLNAIVTPSALPFDPRDVELDVRIGGTDYAAYVFAPALCARLASIAPRIRVHFVPIPATGIEPALSSGRLDLAIAAFPPRGEDLRWRELLRDDVVCLVRKNHPALGAARNGRMRAADFRTYPHVHVAVNREKGSLVEEGTRHTRSTPAEYTVPSHVVAPFVAGTSDLVVVGSRLIAQTVGPLLGLEQLEPPTHVPRVPVVLSWHESRDDTPWMHWLRAELSTLAERTTSHQGPSSPRPATT